MKTAAPNILVVDDSENDAQLMRIVFERAGFTQPLRFAVDGNDALAYLQGAGRYRDRTLFPWPTMMLLDLNMPGKNGFEVLAWLREQPELRRLRVCVLTASSRVEDIERAFDLGASSYLVKPGNLAELVEMAKTLSSWLKLTHFAPLPTEPEQLPFAASQTTPAFRSNGAEPGP
jgi:CheY-like chemotaxis protein